MPEKRIVTRQEAITVEVPSVKHEFAASPLFWRDRLDFGNRIATEFVVAQRNLKMTGDMDKGYITEMAEIDYPALLHIGYPAEKNGIFGKLDFYEMVDLLKIAMDVNGMSRLYYMVDPRLKDPLTLALESATAQDDGQRTPSSTAVSSPESIPTPSSVETAQSD